MEKLEWIADTYLSVSAPVQCAARATARRGRGRPAADPRADGRQSRVRAARRSPDSAADVLHVEGRLVHRRESAARAQRGGVDAGTAGAGERAGAAGIFLRLRVRGVSDPQPADSPGGVSRGSRQVETACCLSFAPRRPGHRGRRPAAARADRRAGASRDASPRCTRTPLR